MWRRHSKKQCLKQYSRLITTALLLLAVFALGGCESSNPRNVECGYSQEGENFTGESAVGSNEAVIKAEVSISSERTTESVNETGSDFSSNLTLGRDGETVKSYLSGFSNNPADYEYAEDCYVLLHGKVACGQENWDRFVASVEQGAPAYVVYVQYTVEGDPILQYLEYNGTNLYLFSDYSRDAFAGTGNRYYEEEYAYLKTLTCHDMEGNKYAYTFLTDADSITMTEIEYYQYVGVYSNHSDEAPDLFYLFEVMVEERERDAPVAKPGEAFEKDVNMLEDVTMELLYATPVSIGVEFKNDSEAEVTYGEAYDLQVLQDGKWYSLSYVIDNAAFNAIGYMLPGGSTRIWGTDWTVFHGVLKEGEYRLVKMVSVEKKGGSENYYLAAEFELDWEDW